eukprot:m.18597 g.18597  ORF g.18597 m.18597 type:complete len:478 (-) comp8334_c0_seq1:1666-3099(-)
MSTTTTIGVTTVGDAGGFSFSLSSGLAVTAAKTVGSVFLIFIVGILASWFPSHPSKSVHLSGILPQSSIRNVAKLCTNILIPCLGFVSLGSTLTIDIIKEAWPMVIWTPVHMIACGIVATILYKVACLPQKYFTEFCVGCVFTNVVSMPLVMLEVLCAQEEVDEGANCFERAASFVFLPVMSWIFIFWTIGLSTIRYIRTGTMPRAKKVALSLLNPAVIANILALIVVLIPPLQRILFDSDGALSFVISSMRIFGNSSVGMMSLLMAITLGKSIGGPHAILNYIRNCCRQGDDNKSNDDSCESCSTEKGNDNSTSQSNMDLEMDIVINSDGDNNNDDDNDNIEDSSDISVLDSSSSPRGMESDLEHATEAYEATESWPILVVVVFVLTSMVIMPLVRLGILFGVGDYIFSGPNKSIILLVLGIQSLSPTANIVIALCQQLRARQMAERVSRAIIVQYLFGIATLLIFTALVVGLVYN